MYIDIVSVETDKLAKKKKHLEIEPPSYFTTTADLDMQRLIYFIFEHLRLKINYSFSSNYSFSYTLTTAVMATNAALKKRQ